MFNLLSDPVNKNRILAGPEPGAVMMDVIVPRNIVSGSQGFSVSSSKPDAAERHVADVAAANDVLRAAVHDDCVSSQIAKLASANDRSAVLCQDDTTAAGAIKVQTLQDKMAGTINGDQRLFQDGDCPAPREYSGIGTSGSWCSHTRDAAPQG
jgi:hypothetical protein